MTNEGSGETVQKCSLVKIFLAHTQKWRMSDHRRFRRDCAQVQSCQNLLSSHTKMTDGRPGKVQGRLCTSAVSSKSSPLSHTKMTDGRPTKAQRRLFTSAVLSKSFLLTLKKRRMGDQGRFRGDCAQVQSCQNLFCSHTKMKDE